MGDRGEIAGWYIKVALPADGALDYVMKAIYRYGGQVAVDTLDLKPIEAGQMETRQQGVEHPKPKEAKRIAAPKESRPADKDGVDEDTAAGIILAFLRQRGHANTGAIRSHLASLGRHKSGIWTAVNKLVEMGLVLKAEHGIYKAKFAGRQRGRPKGKGALSFEPGSSNEAVLRLFCTLPQPVNAADVHSSLTIELGKKALQSTIGRLYKRRYISRVAFGQYSPTAAGEAAIAEVPTAP